MDPNFIKYYPTLNTLETSNNINAFNYRNIETFWKIFKPLIPFIVLLNLMDKVIASVYLANSEYSFTLGSILGKYFTIVLIISWHRVVIHGADNYVPMNPFKPKKHEIIFIAAYIFLPLILIIPPALIILELPTIAPHSVTAIASFIAIITAAYFYYRISFYFPAKAVNSNITLKQTFSLSKGYWWKVIPSSFMASIKLMLLTFAYSIFLITITYALVFLGIGENITNGLSFILKLPIIIYFYLLLTIIQVTALSNYYLYAMQNEQRAVEIE